MTNAQNRLKSTMSGIFPVAPSNPGRNFLSENKKSLRSLEQTTTEKLAAREPVRPKWMPPMRRAATEISDSKGGRPQAQPQQTPRESSLMRNRLNSCSHQQLGVGAAESGQRVGRPEKRAPVYYDRSEEAAQSRDCNSCYTRRNSAKNIATQTEDINDELYLTNALKKCHFDGASMMGERESPNKYDKYYEEQQPQHISHHMIEDQKTAYSREDVRIPRFLEKDKEKRDKAAAQELANASDPDCMLAEQARVGHLNTAQKRYDGLISEINRMPITSQSLWVRNRKAEIDKELAVVDEEIRVYSKPKLYINCSKNK